MEGGSSLPRVFLEPSLTHGTPFAAFTCKEFFAYREHLPVEIDHPNQLDFYMVALITDGSCSHMVDFVTHELNAGTALFVQKGQVHKFDVRDDIHGWIMVFTQDFLVKTLPAYPGFPMLRLLDQTVSPARVHFSDDELDYVVSIFRRMNRESFKEEDNIREAILSRLLGLFLLEAERVSMHQHNEEPVESQYFSTFVAFRDLVEKHFSDRWTVNNYADQLGISRRTLGTVVRIITDLSPKEFIDQHIILQIKRQLTHTSESVTSIAVSFGFDEATGLVKYFRRVENETPGTFRERMHPGS